MNKVIKALSFVREVSPAFPAVLIGDELDTGGEDTEFCGFAELFFKPLPLGVTEEGCGLVFGRNVGTLAAFDTEFGVAGFVQWAAEVACIEEEELYSFSFFADDLCVVDSGRFAAVGILGFVEEIEEDFLGFFLFGEFSTGVVLSIIMIVPNGEDFADQFQAFVSGNSSKLLIFRGKLFHVGGVAVDVVSQKDEDLGFCLDDVVPDGLG